MGSHVEIVSREPEITLAVHAQATLWHIQPVIKKSHEQIMACAHSQSAIPTGAPYVRYFGFDWEALSKEGRLTAFVKSFTRKWDLEIGMPMGSAAQPKDDIVSTEIPGGRFVQAMHVGSYQKVGDTYSELLGWIKQEGVKVKPESLEIYLNDPASTQEEQLRTLVLVPLDLEE